MKLLSFWGIGLAIADWVIFYCLTLVSMTSSKEAIGLRKDWGFNHYPGGDHGSKEKLITQKIINYM